MPWVSMRQVAVQRVATQQFGMRQVGMRQAGMHRVVMGLGALSRFAVRPGAMQAVAGGRRSGVRAGAAAGARSRWKPAGATGRAGFTRATAS